jgi:thioredoxin reductase (NADPH)
MIKTDILGSRSNWFICRFEAGLLKLKCHILDALPQVGGQLSELYPKSPSTIFLDFQVLAGFSG